MATVCHKHKISPLHKNNFATGILPNLVAVFIRDYLSVRFERCISIICFICSKWYSRRREDTGDGHLTAAAVPTAWLYATPKQFGTLDLQRTTKKP